MIAGVKNGILVSAHHKGMRRDSSRTPVSADSTAGAPAGLFSRALPFAGEFDPCGVTENPVSHLTQNLPEQNRCKIGVKSVQNRCGIGVESVWNRVPYFPYKSFSPSGYRQYRPLFGLAGEQPVRNWRIICRQVLTTCHCWDGLLGVFPTSPSTAARGQPAGGKGCLTYGVNYFLVL